MKRIWMFIDVIFMVLICAFGCKPNKIETLLLINREKAIAVNDTLFYAVIPKGDFTIKTIAMITSNEIFDALKYTIRFNVIQISDTLYFKIEKVKRDSVFSMREIR